MEIEQSETFFEKVKSNLKDLFCETWDVIFESVGEWFSALHSILNGVCVRHPICVNLVKNNKF